MTTKEARAEDRATFRNRYDSYAKRWSILGAIDAWRSDNRTTEPLFTKAMWREISGATYPEPVILNAYHDGMDKARRTRIKGRIGGMLYAGEIADLAFQMMKQNRNYTTERAVTLARVEVYDRYLNS